MLTDTQIDHNEVFDLAYRFVTETNENIFLTGKAGTGKTTFLKYLRDNSTKNIIVAAPTGVAAINAGGVTLHSLFQLPFQPFLPTKTNKIELLARIRINKQRQQLLRKVELLIIDEISMVRCDVMDAIDTILRSVRGNHHLPFGGIQLLCIGDLFQLPPVAQNQEWNILSEYYASPFFFDSLVIKEQMPLLIELNKIYRQNDSGFVELLNKVRNNRMSKEDFESLHLRYNPLFQPPEEEKYITLTSHNNQADNINRQKLHRILSPALTYEAIISDDFPEHLYPADASLVVKTGAQVMFLKNDTVMKRYFNGKIGVIRSLEKEKITVDCDGSAIEVYPETWENTRYSLNRNDGKLELHTLGSFTQFPLRLAWAITIHKSQGLTFDKLMIDAGAAFSSGQVYVALSRSTSLEGIVLLSKIPPGAIYNNENIVTAQQSLTPLGSLHERFSGARQVFTLQLLEEIFLFREIVHLVERLSFAVNQHRDKLNSGALEWTEHLKQRILAEKEVGLKFTALVSGLMKNEPVIEKNELLQKRISDAAHHFIPVIEAFHYEISNHPLITEHKETADSINELLHDLALALYTISYYLTYCKEPFSVTSFLQHKLKFAQPRFNLTCYASGKKQAVTDIPNKELFEILKSWRDSICEETGLPIYMVANQASIKEICTWLPLSKKNLLQISGFGKAKVDKYGEDIIDAVENYCTFHNIESRMDAFIPAPRKQATEKKTSDKPDTKLISFTLFKSGKSINEIAKERNFVAGTILSHLTHFVETGELEISKLLSPEKQQTIKSMMDKLGHIGHKTILENLPEGYTYSDIKLVIASSIIPH